MGPRHQGGTDRIASSYLKCLRFLLPNKPIANTLVSSCADRSSGESFVFQTGTHNNSVEAKGVGEEGYLKIKTNEKTAVFKDICKAKVSRR